MAKAKVKVILPMMRGALCELHGDRTLTMRRLSRLEHTVSALVERLDCGVQTQRWEPRSSNTPRENPPEVSNTAPGSPSAAPVLLIRDVASELGVRQQQSASISQGPKTFQDIVSRGLIQLQEATDLIQLFVLPSIDTFF